MTKENDIISLLNHELKTTLRQFENELYTVCAIIAQNKKLPNKYKKLMKISEKLKAPTSEIRILTRSIIMYYTTTVINDSKYIYETRRKAFLDEYYKEYSGELYEKCIPKVEFWLASDRTQALESITLDLYSKLIVVFNKNADIMVSMQIAAHIGQSVPNSIDMFFLYIRDNILPNFFTKKELLEFFSK